MSEDTLATLHTALRQVEARRTEGGMAGLEGDPVPRMDATAWAVLALRGARAVEPGATERSALAATLRDDLARAQHPDGRVTVTPEQPTAYWPTTLATLAWTPSTAHADAAARSIDFLLTRSGGLAMPNSPFVGHDATLIGWSWIQATHSWVEPTSMALLALRLANRADHARCSEAEQLLLDRQIEGGGWNYGNTRTFEQIMHPAPDSTGVALTGLAGRVPATEVAPSLTYLEETYPRLRSPLALSWATLGLSAWQRRPPDADAALARALARQDQLGAFDTSLLALVALALSAPRGLPEALR